MLIITPPILKSGESETRIECTIAIDGNEEVLYYSTPIEWGKYLTFERADAFLLGVLQYAMKEGHDIEVKAPVSERLYFNLVNQVIPLLSAGFGHKRIKLICHQLDSSVLMADTENPFAVGTGCSLGVDSFGSILYHLQPDTPPSFRLTHLTYFNVGALGNDTEKATVSYEHDLPMIQEYAAYKQMPLVQLSSNIGQLYTGWNFDICHLTRNIGAVMALQKLFQRYVYASSHPTSDLQLSDKATGYFETALAPYLSTENTDVIIGQPSFSRVEKTRYIAQYSETFSRLYVCWREVLKNDYNGQWVNLNSTKINCSTCYKCKRTMLAIDILGKKDCYSGVFDWASYDRQRDALIGFVLANKDRKGRELLKELCELMVEENFVVPKRAKWYWHEYKLLYKLGLQKFIRF